MSPRVMLFAVVSVILLAQYEAAPRPFGIMIPSLPYDNFRARRSILHQHDLTDLIAQYEAVPTRFGFMSPFLSGFPGRNVADSSHQKLNKMIMDQKASRTQRSIYNLQNLRILLKWPSRNHQAPHPFSATEATPTTERFIM